MKTTKNPSGLSSEFEITPPEFSSLKDAFNDIYLAAGTLTSLLHDYKAFTLSVAVRVKIEVDEFIDADDEEKTHVKKTYYINNSRKYEVLTGKQIDETLPLIVQDLNLDIENKEFNRSDVKVTGIDKIHFQVVKYNPLRGAKYIELPVGIDKRKACINIRNDDIYFLNIVFKL